MSTLLTFAAAPGTAAWAHVVAGSAAASSTMQAMRMTALGRSARVTVSPSLSHAHGLEPRQHPSERAGADTPERNLGHQQERARAAQPRPQVQGETGLPAALQEDVARLAHRAAARQLRDLPEKCLVHAQVPELLRIGYHQPRQLRADHLVALALRHADEGDALLRGAEAPAVPAGADLLELHHGALLVGRPHADLRVEEVDELALAVDGVHHDLAGLFHARDRRPRVAAGSGPERPSRHLRPELVEAAPAQPEHAPLALGVRGEGHGATQAVAPRGQKRVLLVGHEDHLGIALERGGNVAAEGRGLLPVHLLSC